MAEKKLAAKLKKKKKRWIPILAPEIFDHRMIGESFSAEPSSLLRKEVTVNFMNLTGDMKKQHLNIRFRILEIKDGKGITEVVGYYIIPSSIKRFIRKGREKVDSSFVAVTADNRHVRLKPMLITNSTTHQSVLTNLRNTTKKILQNVIATYTYDKVIEGVLTYNLQKYLRDVLHKIYPIKICEIRDFYLLERAPLNFKFTPEDITPLLRKNKEKKQAEPGQEEEEEVEELASEQEEASAEPQAEETVVVKEEGKPKPAKKKVAAE